MFIPYGTDAPIYHWPFATVGLIVVNVVLFFAVPVFQPPPSTTITIEEPEGDLDPDMALDGDSHHDEATKKILSALSPSWYSRQGLSLWLGQGLHPSQWLTHNFLHAGLIHLIGNMIFLWAYGIVVEGK